MNLQDLESKYKELGAEIERLKAQPTAVWEPEKGGGYWLVGFGGTTLKRTLHLVDGSEDNYSFLSLKAHHNVYKTRELAEKASVLQRRSNLVIQACLNVDPDFEPDWSDSYQTKYGFCYDHYNGQWEITCSWYGNFEGAVVSTEEKADQVFEYLNSQEIK